MNPTNAARDEERLKVAKILYTFDAAMHGGFPENAWDEAKAALLSLLREARIKEAAAIHYAGVKLLAADRRATLNQLLTAIEQRHGKDNLIVNAPDAALSAQRGEGK